MSDFNALIAMAFLLVMLSFLMYYVYEKVNVIGFQILTGVVQGTPVSTGVRQAMLFQMWVPYQTGPIGIGVFLALAASEIADHVGDTNVRMLAYFAAFLCAGVAIMALVNTVSGFFQYRTVLSRASRKRIDDGN